MAVDTRIKQAIEEVVSNARQPQGLANRLTRWFEAIANGDEDVHNMQDANRRLELLYRDVQIDDDAEFIEEEMSK